MKKWYESKTVWFNILSAAAVAVNELTGKIIPAEYAATAIVFINLALRFVTSAPVTK